MIEGYFVCIGAQKAGTTWLARALADHPELFLTPVKEIHYFDHVAGLTQHLSRTKRLSRWRRYHQRMWTQPRRFTEHWAQRHWYRAYMRDPIDDDWYARILTLRGGMGHAGEMTPEYAIIGREGFAHMRRLAPDARVLFVMRDPVEQAWSSTVHVMGAEGRDAGRANPEELLAVLDRPRQRALADYGRTLEDVLSVFPASQVHTMFYEDIHADRVAALREICRFIGIGDPPAAGADLDRRVNTSREAEVPVVVEAELKRHGSMVAAAVRAIVGRVPSSWPG